MILRGLGGAAMMRCLFFLGLLAANINCTVAQKVSAPAARAINGNQEAGLSFKTFPSTEGSFGYDIYKDGKLLIHQPSVPGLQGNKGFIDSSAAARVAGLVIKKIRQGQMPPTITLEELRKEKAID